MSATTGPPGDNPVRVAYGIYQHPQSRHVYLIKTLPGEAYSRLFDEMQARKPALHPEA